MTGLLVRAACPALLAGVVLACDVLLPAVRPDLVLTGMLDESAHLATTALVLMAVPRAARPRRRFTVLVLAASVLIDLDHVPLYLGVTSIAPFGRPVTHSLLTPLVLVAAGALLPRARRVLSAAALGVCLHFVRDIATGPGLSLYWPLDPRNALLPYPWYAAAVGALGVAGVARLVLGSRVRRRRAEST